MPPLTPPTVVLAAAQSIIGPVPRGDVALIRNAERPAQVLVARDHDAQLALAANADILFGDVQPDVLDIATRLRWVQSVGAGVDRLLPALAGRDVVLTSAKGGVVGSHLAEHAMALLLSLTRGVSRSQRRPGWGWDHRIAIRATQWELTDRSMLIVGFGGAGQALARRARGFEMPRIVAVDPAPPDAATAALVDDIVHPDQLDAHLGAFDVVVLTVPLTPATAGLLDDRRIALMKPGAVVINVSRGGLIDDVALRGALASGHLSGAGLDVLAEEPIAADDEWWDLPNVVLTPHIAGGSPRRASRVVAQFCDNLRRWDDGVALDGVYDPARGF